jgi:hypothetical protein
MDVLDLMVIDSLYNVIGISQSNIPLFGYLASDIATRTLFGISSRHVSHDRDASGQTA